MHINIHLKQPLDIKQSFCDSSQKLMLIFYVCPCFIDASMAREKESWFEYRCFARHRFHGYDNFIGAFRIAMNAENLSSLYDGFSA